ncbi:MAG: serine--tRNA ligase [Bacteroidales bacterium]|nr:serine--tRNA ligase [Bacteroidales bacterium]MCF8334284.1 serine--tRNA ligase [Bacteroidales bacterium]
MLDIHYIRENHEEVIERLKVKNFDATNLVTRILEIDKKRRETQSKLDSTLSESKRLSKEIGTLFKDAKLDEANELKEKTAQLKEKSKELSAELENLKKEQQNLLTEMPNLPHPSVKKGQSDEDNEIIEQEAKESIFNEKGEPHWELADKYDVIDFNTGSKISGAGFPIYKRKLARLQRALINYFLDLARSEGYEEVQPPVLVNEDSGYGTGQLPDKEGQMYELENAPLYLIPTAEVPVTNMYRDMILQEKQFPIKNVAYSSCFRREAGSYGKEVRGLNRLHQFDKVEIVQIQHPDKSYDTLTEMIEYVKRILRNLELPFRVSRLCGGDTSFAAAVTYDLEVYSKGQKKWLEVSSVSNFETYQSLRMKTRFKNKEGKMQAPHTLNGSALALPRVVAALMENNQTSAGIKLPEVIVPYTGFDYIN